MKKYIRLIRIKYDNKMYDIFLDNNHLFSFLEVKTDEGKEKYYYPELNSYLKLYRKYNIASSILYSKEYTFKNRIMLGTIALTYLLTSSYPYESNNNIELLPQEENNEVIEKSEVVFCEIEDVENENYKISGNLVVLKKVEELEKVGINNVTFEELRETFAENSSLKENFFTYKYVYGYINSLEEKMPNIDLRVFNHNLKTLEINIIPEEEWENKEIAGYYSITENKIGIRESYRHNLKTFYHELSHALTNTYMKGNIEIDGRYMEDAIIYRGVKEIYDEYGKSMDEGMNTIITAYLLSEDYKNFFDSTDDSNLTVYTDIVDIYFEGYKLIKKDYPIEEYLNGYYTDFEDRLMRYDIYDLIPLCDTILETEEDEKALLIEDSNFQMLKEEILKNRLIQLQNYNATEPKIIKELGLFDLEGKYDIYYEQTPFEEHVIEIETNDNKVSINTTVTITDNGNIVYDSGYYNIYVYGENGNYRFAVEDKTVKFGEFEIDKEYHDLLTNEKIDDESYNFYNLYTLATGIFNVKIGTSSNHKLTLDTNILNDPLVIEYYDQLNKNNEEQIIRR